METPPKPKPTPTPKPPQVEPLISGRLKLLVLLFAFGGAALFLFGVPFVGDAGNEKGPPATRVDDPQGNVETTTPQSDDVLTSAGFAVALNELRKRVGVGADLTRVQISPGYGQFHTRNGEEPQGFAFGSGTDHSGLSAIDIQVIGPAKLADFDFPLARVHAAAIDRLVAAAKRAEGSGVDITALDLRRDPVDNHLRWEVVVNSERRRGAIYHAAPSGLRFKRVGGDVVVQPEFRFRFDPQKVAACVRRAGSDPERIQKCLR